MIGEKICKNIALSEIAWCSVDGNLDGLSTR